MRRLKSLESWRAASHSLGDRGRVLSPQPVKARHQRPTQAWMNRLVGFIRLCLPARITIPRFGLTPWPANRPDHGSDLCPAHGPQAMDSKGQP